MYCKNCGSYSPDGAKFCQNCGSEFEQPAPPQAAAEPGFAFEPVAFSAAPAAPSGNSLYAVLRGAASSRLFLTAIIFYGLSILAALAVNIASALAPAGNWIAPLLEQFAAQSDALQGIMRSITPEFSAAAQVYSLLIGFAGLIPNALIFTGMLMTYVSAVKSNRTGGRIHTGGLMIIKVIQIISLVSICIVSGLVLLALAIIVPTALMAAGAAGSAALPPLFIPILAAVSVLLLGMVTLVIIYLAKIVGMVGRLKDFADGGAAYTKPSMFVIVMGFISAAGMLLSNIPAIICLSPAACTAIIGIAALVLLISLLCKYRGDMRAASLHRQS